MTELIWDGKYDQKRNLNPLGRTTRVPQASRLHLLLRA
jgi:hypothetical protein